MEIGDNFINLRKLVCMKIFGNLLAKKNGPIKNLSWKKDSKFQSLCDGGVIAKSMMLITYPRPLKESEEDEIDRIKFTQFNKKQEYGMCMLQNSYHSGLISN